MEKQRVPETRVQLDQRLLSEVPAGKKLSDESFTINFGDLDSLNRLTPGVHLPNRVETTTTVHIQSEFSTDPSTYEVPSFSTEVAGGSLNLRSSPTQHKSRSSSYEALRSKVTSTRFESAFHSTPKLSGSKPFVSSSFSPVSNALPTSRSATTRASSTSPTSPPSFQIGTSFTLSEASKSNGRIDTRQYLAPLRLSTKDSSELNDHSRNDPPSPDEITCDSGLGDPYPNEEDRLRLHVARLEGRLLVYSKEAETWLRERAELFTEASSLRKRLEIAQKNYEEVKEKHQTKVDEMKTRTECAEGELQQLRASFSQKCQETEQLAKKLTSAQQETASLKGQLTEVQQKSAAKDQAIESLKEKLAQLHADVESFRYAHSQMLENKTDLSAELSSLKQSQEWYSQQLQLTQAARDRLQNELLATQRWLNEGGTSAHQLAQENARLETKLLASEAALADAKRNLSRQLEAIRADIWERESVFEKLVAERSSLESFCQQKSIQLSDCQARITALQNNLAEAENETSSHRTSLEKLNHTLQTVETERDALRRSVNNLETQLTQQRSAMDEQMAQYATLNEKLSRLDGKNNELTENVNRLLEEKATLEASLRSAQSERLELTACLNQLKNDMSGLDNKYCALHHELEAKNGELISLLSSRDELTGDLEVLQAGLQAKLNELEELRMENEHLQSTLASFRAENEGLREDMRRLSVALEKVEASIKPACEVAAEKAKEPLLAELSQSTAEVNRLKDNLHKVNVQLKDLLADQERHCILIKEHQGLQEQYDSLLATRAAEAMQASLNHSTLSQKLKEAEAVYSENLTQKSREIDSLTEQLNAKTTEVLQISAQLASTKTQHQEALDKQAAEWSARFSDLEARLAATEAQRWQAEQHLQATLQREQETLTRHQQEILSYQQAVARLESRAAEADGLEAQQRQLISQLEAFKGRELGLSDVVRELKRHKETLEAALSSQRADLVELAEKTERQAETLEETRRQLSANETIIPIANSVPLMSAPPPATLSPHCDKCMQLTAEVRQFEDSTARLQAELAKAQASLELANQEAAAQAAKAANETMAKEEAINSRRSTMTELDKLKKELASVTEQLCEANHRLQQSSSNISLLQSKVDLDGKATSAEVQALQSVIQAMTNHLESLKRELAEAKNEAWSAQSALANIRGSLRGLLERHRMFSELDYTSASVGGVDSRELEKLLSERIDEPLMQSKPLLRVSNYLDTLQREINSLEEQVVEHANIVRDSVARWRSVEEEAVLVRAQPLLPPS
nr:unnamed protein product [Spirometra erinaceieuropaei]